MTEMRSCQSCKQNFLIEEADFDFYKKISVPPPTWCPECRLIRRLTWRNERFLFKRKEGLNNKDIFSGYPNTVPATIYHLDDWWSDKWDAMSYGRDYDFSRPFFDQYKELLYTVPWPAKSTLNMVNSEYCEQAGGLKNCYLYFNGNDSENSAYIVSGYNLKDSFDLYEARHTELSYDNYMADEGYRIFYSVNIEESTDIWFSRNLMGCTNCFGCVNLRNKSYHIFNQQYSKEEYKKYMDDLNLGSWKTVVEYREKAHAFWAKHPMRYTLAIQVQNSTGEHIERSKNLKDCYSIHEGQNLAYSQFLEPPISDSYDFSNFGMGASEMYESLTCGFGVSRLKFCWECWNSGQNQEYSIFCRGSENLFGCVSLNKKQYCILNKQYSKEEYFALREKIIAQMNELPFTDKQGRTYRYGEFFPTDFSPFAYNDTMAQDFFPLTKDEALARGYAWRDVEEKEYQTTKTIADLPDDIKEVPDSILQELVQCGSCKKAYRIIQAELDFLRRIDLPLPRMCPNCRYMERFKFVNPPKLWPGKCMCSGKQGRNPGSGIDYQNAVTHAHGEGVCSNEFRTSYEPGRPEILYCEQCYQAETV